MVGGTVSVVARSVAVFLGIGLAAFATIAVAGRGADVMHAMGLVLAVVMAGALLAALVVPVQPPADETARRRGSTGLAVVVSSCVGAGAVTTIAGPVSWLRPC